MRNNWTCAAILLILFATICHGQSYRSMKPGRPIVVYAGSGTERVSIPAPREYAAWRQRSGARTESAQFDVNYINFTDQAKAAFQEAVDIWSSLLTSPVTIHVTAVWKPQDPGVLGSAIWGSVHANFDGAQRLNTWYPVALAEKMAGTDLNDPSDIDIYAEFSSTFNWYYGLDGKATTGTYDLVTVVLHELGHGLGFVGSHYVSNGNGYVGAVDTDLPMVYDLYLENNAGQNLYRDFDSGTKPLYNQLVSGALYFDSPSVLAVNGGQRARIYAPNPFSEGSSISHLDDIMYPTGTVNSLMTSQLGKQEAIHDPGPIVKAVFADLGWQYTRIAHKDLKDNEDVTGPYVIKATITSDNGPIGTPQLHYSRNGAAEVTTGMTPTGQADEYQATIPSLGVAATYRYYISVADVSGQLFTRPGQVVAPHQDPEQQYTWFKTGPDTEKPVIHHTAPTYVASADKTFTIEAYVTDNLGLASVTLTYTINDVPYPDLPMTAGMPDSLYTAAIDITGLANDAQIKYRIKAVDAATVPNTAVDPGAGDHNVRVIVIGDAVEVYVTDFENAGGDFFGDFTIREYTGFDNMALHTPHPYAKPTGTAGTGLNLVSQLRLPIRVKTQDATVIFDEVVLVEPNDEGSTFGADGFYDYVIVEGSKDGGTSWQPLADGYNSRYNSAWLTRYNSSLDSEGNSVAVGDKSLFRTHTLNLLPVFSAGDELLLRFRLYSDELTTGWGWAIDNLYIQTLVVATEANAAADLKIYPNPVQSEIRLSMETALDGPLDLTLVNAQGQVISTRHLESHDQAWADRWDVSALGAGVYVLKIDGQDKHLVKKIVKTGY